MKNNKNRKQPPAQPTPVSDLELYLRQLRATDSELANPAPLPLVQRPKKVGLIRRTFGNHPELHTPQPQTVKAETPEKPKRPEGVHREQAAGIGYVALGAPRTAFEARRAEILQREAIKAQQEAMNNPQAPTPIRPTTPPQGPQPPFQGQQ